MIRSRVIHGDNLQVLHTMESESVDLVYIDPPFNTGKAQKRLHLETKQDVAGDRTGFGGKRYATVRVGSRAFEDFFDDYLAFLEPRLIEAHRILKPTGS